VTPFAADFAADGIDELIMGFLGRDSEDGPGGQRSLRVVAADAGADWIVALTPDGARAVHVERGGSSGADATVRGPASAVYLVLWNRAGRDDGDVSVEGDSDLVKSWQERLHITWG
jgi:MDMPI C-terminal domain